MYSFIIFYVLVHSLVSNKENIAYLFMDRTFILFKHYCHVEVIIHSNQIYCWNNAIFKDEPFGVTF